MKQTINVLTALIAGFVGGVVGFQVTTAYNQTRSESVIRARSFELVDASGYPISFWGVDKGENVVMAFGSQGGPHSGSGLRDPDGNGQRLAIGTTADTPFIFFKTPGGAKVMSLTFGMDPRPVLWMGDETGPRLRLGTLSYDTPVSRNNDWVLAFEPNSATRIGVVSRKDGVRGFLYVDDQNLK